MNKHIILNTMSELLAEALDSGNFTLVYAYLDNLAGQYEAAAKLQKALDDYIEDCCPHISEHLRKEEITTSDVIKIMDNVDSLFNPKEESVKDIDEMIIDFLLKNSI